MNLRNLFRFRLLPLVLAFFVSIADAAPILVDPDGGGDNYLAVATFDFLPGNLLGQGAVTAFDTYNPNNPSASQFNALLQAQLGNFLSPSSAVIPVTGLGSSFEWTLTFSARQQFVSQAILPSGEVIGAFELAPSAGNVLQIWYHSVQESDNLSGLNFGLTANAQLILQADLAVSSATIVARPSVVGPLDQFQGNNYPGVDSIASTGSFDVSGVVSFVNPNFIKAVNQGDILDLAFLNGNLVTPFRQVDPSAQFFNGVTPNIGSINGISGPDFLLQTDVNGSFTVVPEASTLVLAGLGGLGLVLVGRRRIVG